MATEGSEAANIQTFVDYIRASAMSAQAGDSFDGQGLVDLWRRPEPQLLPIPSVVRGFRIRIDLQRTKPPVWRRVEVPGDILLPRLHEVIQAAMGWTDSHLHRFRTSNDQNPPEFLTRFDLAEGTEGMLEEDVRLDQVLAAEGDRLWYDYDFGDDWNHLLHVEKVLDSPPPAPTCVGGRLACPPEDCGGVWGYAELAAWVRADYDNAILPQAFDSAAEGRNWLPDGWHPDTFAIGETNELIAAAMADPVPLVEELESLLELADNVGARGVRDALAHPAISGATDVSAEDAADLAEPFLVLLDVVGPGVTLTNAGYLRPAAVEQIAHRTGVTDWWIGKANREDLTRPVMNLRTTARALGLVAVRKGRIAPTQAIAKHRDDPQAILRHIVGRLPLGRTPDERHAGWMALTVAANETPAELWDSRISELMFELGWSDSKNPYRAPAPGSATLDVLRLLGGSMRGIRRPRGVNKAVAAMARAVILP